MAGCAAGRPQLERALRADAPPHAAEARYAVRCPDVLDVEVTNRPDWSGPRPVGPDGCLRLADGRALRVDGLTAPEVAVAVAKESGVGPAWVRVRVAEFNSRQLYLVGEVPGLPRAVAYHGPETVLDLLRRAGGLAPGAAVDEVRVVRAHVADGKPPEVFHVDLPAIVLRREAQTNVVLEPFDHVHVGRSGKARLCAALPPWLRPFARAACGLRRP